MNVEIRLFNGHIDWDYANSNAGMIACEDTCGITAVDKDTGEHIGCVVFDSFTRSSALAHVVVTNQAAIRHGLLEEAVDYAYDYRDRSVLYGLIPACNETAIKFDKHIGFTEVVRLKDGYDEGIDYVLMEMHRDDCAMFKRAKQELEA